MQIRLDPDMVDLLLKRGMEAIQMLPKAVAEKSVIECYRLHKEGGGDRIGAVIHLTQESFNEPKRKNS